MKNGNGTTYVRWSVMSILLLIFIGVLGVMWSEIKSANEESSENGRIIVEVRNDVKWIKSLIDSGQEVTLKLNNGK